MGETRRLFWTAVWLAIAFVSVKACYLGVPAVGLTCALESLLDIAAVSYVDVLFAAGVWACGRAALGLVGDVRMLRSSVTAQVTPYSALGLVLLPIVYVALVHATVRLTPVASGPVWRRSGIALATLVAWVVLGQFAFARDSTTLRDQQLARTPQWVFVSSWWRTMAGDGAVRMTDRLTASCSTGSTRTSDAARTRSARYCSRPIPSSISAI